MNTNKRILGLITSSILKNIYGVLRGKSVAVLLDSNALGILGQAITYFSTFTKFGSLGIDAALISVVSNQKQRTKQLTTIVLLFIILINIASFIITFSILDLINSYVLDKQVLPIFIFVLIISSSFSAICTVLESIYQANNRLDIIIKIQNLRSILSIVFIFPLIYYFGVNGIVYSIFLFILISFLGYIFFLSPYVTFKDDFSNVVTYKPILKMVISVASADFLRKLIVLFSLLFLRTQIVHNLGMSSNGEFQIVWSLATYPDVLISAFIIYFFPAAASKRNKKNYFEFINNNFLTLLLIVLPVFFVLVLFPDVIIFLFFSFSYTHLMEELNFFLILKLFEVIYNYFLIILLANSRLKFFVQAEILKYSLLLSSFILLHEYFGFYSILAAFAISNIVSVIFVIYAINKCFYDVIKINTIKTFLKYLILIFMLALPVQTFGYLWLIKILFGILFFTLLFDVNLIKEKYKSAYRSIFK